MKIRFTPHNLRTILLAVLFMFLYQGVQAQTSHIVDVTNNKFTPAEITITAGDEVTWTNSQGFHNVNGTTGTYPNNPESFGNNTGSGWTYSYTFTTPGVYDYQCDPHVGLGMVGKVIVEEPLTLNELTINFSGMDPHVGQELWIRVEETESGDEVFRGSEVVAASFSIVVPGIETGSDYVVEMYADHNENGRYDAPGDDHAWSVELNNVDGNETIDFAHNTNFTDIEWEHAAIVQLSGMNPHVGQDITFILRDTDSDDIVSRSYDIVTESFQVVLPGLVEGNAYEVDFYSDHNENGRYDAPGTDHAWRLEIPEANGDEVLEFAHNTNFTDIEYKHVAIVNLTGMNPHVGQEIYFALIETSTGTVVDRESEIVSESFSVTLDELESGVAYHIDFFADHNDNDHYDAPADDHAWRLEIASANGDEVFDFMHNTNFTDIEWKHRLRVRFDGMDPHVGQMLKLYVKDQSTGDILDSVVVSSIDDADFDIESHILEVGGDYFVDFYADLNESGGYDAPPVDHAWRLVVDNAMGDVDLDFTHNTTFTDIMDSGATNTSPAHAEMGIMVYPNPAFKLITVEAESTIRSAEILSVTGSVVKSLPGINTSQHTISLDELAGGVYFLKVTLDHGADSVVRIMKR